MSVNLHKLRMTDGAGFPRLWNRLLDELQRGTIAAVTSPLRMSQDGAGIRLEVTVPSTSPAAAEEEFPFQIYSYPENDVEDSSRAFRVRGGTVNNEHPDNDDTGETPLEISVDYDTTLYKVWLECTIDNDPESATYCTMTAVTLACGADGWTDYPAQPDGDDETGAPPDTYYILVGEISVSSEGVTTIPPQTTQTALSVFAYALDLECSEEGFILTKRLGHLRV
jgi:hypothetical protein